MTITFVDAVAIRENVVRVEFSEVVNFTGLLEPEDVSLPSHWLVTADASTTGMAGDAARVVGVIGVELAGSNAGVETVDLGRFVNLLLDRPMTPYPGVYAVTWTDISASDFSSSVSGSTTIFGAYRVLAKPTIESPRRSKDFAAPVDPFQLGTFGIDETGDYAMEEGIVSLKKRIVRRLTTKKGAFLHLPTYGVGIPQELKKLATNETLSRLRGDAELQISEEPDVQQVKVTLVIDPTVPDLVRFRVAVKPKLGNAVAFEVPFDTA